MNERKWTPGPWHVGADPDDGPFIGGGGYCRANMVGPSAERMPNAHLIAAAPDLYEALQAMVDYCNAECGSKIYPGHQASQALAKARGETQ